MLNNRISENARKIVIGLLVGVSVLLTSIFIGQHNKINELKKEVYVQTQMTEERQNYTETEIDTSSIEERFNNEKKYEILNGTINIKHSYHRERDSILGLKSYYKLTGTADFYYSYIVNLSSYKIIEASKNKIKISIDKPELDELSCHRVPNTFYRLNDECSTNILSNKDDAETTARQWEDTFDIKGIENVKEYYNFKDKTKLLESKTKTAITELLRELGYKQRIEIVFSEEK